MGMTALLCAWSCTLGFTGCESPAWTHTLHESFRAQDEGGPRTEEEYRRDYVKTHSRKSMRWLLAHCVRPGMSYEKVCHALGQEGERETDRTLKTTGINVRIDDDVYSFEDNEGRALKLFFRDDRLINFDPTDFE
jgi:hypothetical protein